jgi:6-phosphogluconolactonase
LQVIETERTAHCVTIEPAERNVFVPHVAPNAVYQFRFDSRSGRLTEFGRAPGGEEGAGPRHLAMHPTNRFAFTSDEQGSSITLYSHDPESGLKPLKTLSTLPDGFEDRNTTAEVKVHPSGKFAWVSNRGHDSLAGFRFDADSGALTALGQTPTEKTPRSFDIEPQGRFLFSAG